LKSRCTRPTPIDPLRLSPLCSTDHRFQAISPERNLESLLIHIHLHILRPFREALSLLLHLTSSTQSLLYFAVSLLCKIQIQHSFLRPTILGHGIRLHEFIWRISSFTVYVCCIIFNIYVSSALHNFSRPLRVQFLPPVSRPFLATRQHRVNTALKYFLLVASHGYTFSIRGAALFGIT
jgi:hypothetical protein